MFDFENWWNENIAIYPPVVLLTLGNIFVIWGMNIICAIFFTVLDIMKFSYLEDSRLVWFKRYDGGLHRKYPTYEEWMQSFWSFLYLNIFITAPLSIVGWPFLNLRGFSATGEFPTLFTMAWQFVVFMVVEDFFGYWVHRWMHSPWAWKNIHSVHHKKVTPFGLTDMYMHPGEIICMGFPVVAGPMMLNPHLLTHWLWVSYRLLDSYYQHSGYEFAFDIRPKLGFGGPRFHDAHHWYIKGNYSFNLRLFDYIFGTLRGYEGDEKALRPLE